MKRKLIKFVVAAVLLAQGLKAQQDPNYVFYRYNMNIYNPAFAGSNTGTDLVLGVRSQWAGVEGAPENQSVVFGTPVGKKVGLGAVVVNDKTFIETQTWLAVDFSYALRLTESTRLFLGIKGSANSYDANTDGLVTYGVGQDASLMGYKGRFTPNVGAGAYLKGTKYFLSLSVPKIFTPDRLQERNGDAYVGSDRLAAYFSGGYRFGLGGDTSLEALSMVRYIDDSPIGVEFTGILDFGSRFNLGASYHIDESFAGLFIFKVGGGFQLGYGYETSIQSDIDALDHATHEIMLRLSF